VPSTVPLVAFIERIPEQTHFFHHLRHIKEARREILSGWVMCATIVLKVKIIKGTGDLGKETKELRGNRSKEILEGLRGWVSEVEEIVDVKNSAIAGTSCETPNDI
jgi:hypothetical protein